MKLVEELSGAGELAHQERTLHNVRYQIRRFQGIAASGLPIPGLFRIEGRISTDSSMNFETWIDVPLVLRLQDGRALGIIVVDQDGRILSEGHGPSRCLCC